MTTVDPTTARATTEQLEPMLLLDITGSMNYPAAVGSLIKRRTVVQEAISLVVATLAEKDSQAAHEEDGGGLMTITFADGHATRLGDLNPNNLTQLWSRINWGGGTYILPGFEKVQQVYREEFDKVAPDERPKLLLLIITDGEADDTGRFTHTLAAIGGGMYTEVCIVGYGSEHDRALASYQRVAEQNTHVKVTSFDGETDPQTIADSLLRMIA